MDKKRQEILRDIFYSEELKIDSDRAKALKKTIDSLCVDKNRHFNETFSFICEDIAKSKKERCSTNQYQAMYMYQAERLSSILKKLGKEDVGGINDSILWQV